VGWVLNSRTCAIVARAHEPRLFIELRTSLHAAAAGDAAERDKPALSPRRHARPGRVVGAVDGNPSLDDLQILKDHALRSVARIAQIGNLETVPAEPALEMSIKAEQAMRARPLMSMAHDPQTSSRHSSRT